MSLFNKKINSKKGKEIISEKKETSKKKFFVEEKKEKMDPNKKIRKVSVDYGDVTEEKIEKLISIAANAEAQNAIVDLFNNIMVFASNQLASDVHLEPWDESAIIRIRVDGILYDKFEVVKNIHKHLISFLKILTKMRTDEHRSPQDGRFEFEVSGGSVDVRASIIPTYNGEKAVLRFLSSKSHKLTLEQLGFMTTDLERVSRAIHRNWGMILSTGPTGSGKTTTIYSILEEINKREVNITTIEDPVEFEIQGVNQSQVDRVAKMDFATGLRSLLRQDPDVLMVGEIRDHETAKIAVNAAMTGHKLLSTLHTNDAATTALRLIDMGVEPYLVSSTLICAIGQRLVRKLCPDCEKTKTLTRVAAKKILKQEHVNILFGSKKEVTIATAGSCFKCNGTGYKGRIGVYEVLENTSAIQDLILKRANSAEIQATAVKLGMTSMAMDGLKKVSAKLTTLDEFIRVMQE